LDLQPPPLSLEGREELRPGGFQLIDTHPQPLNGVRMLETDPGGRQCRIHDERLHFPLGQFDDRRGLPSCNDSGIRPRSDRPGTAATLWSMATGGS